MNIDTSAMTQEQKNLIVAGAYQVMYKHGYNVVPTWDGTNLEGDYVDKTVTYENLLAEINTIIVAATSKEVADSGEGRIPIGGVIEFAGSKAPAGWRFCDGAEVTVEEYQSLFTVLGASAVSGKFNLPVAEGKIIKV